MHAGTNYNAMNSYLIIIYAFIILMRLYDAFKRQSFGSLRHSGNLRQHNITISLMF